MVFGQKINRRNALKLLGAGGATVLAAPYIIRSAR